MKKAYYTLLGLFIVTGLFSQPTLNWVNQFQLFPSPPSAQPSFMSMTTDVNGNVFSVGTFTSSVDMDPGPGIFTLTTGSLNDVYIVKMNSAGGFLWAKQLGNIGAAEQVYEIVTDAAGNSYITGFFNVGTVDFDPGPGTFTVNSNGGNDVFILKLDPNGNFIWVKTFGGTAAEYPYAITLDASGNIYTTGVFEATVDFDPGPGTYTLSSTGATDGDAFFQKLDPNGNFVWARKIGTFDPNPAFFFGDIGKFIKVDGSGNVYVTGQFVGTEDFDPGPGTYTLTSNGGSDEFILKLDAAGNFVYARNFGGTGNDEAEPFVVDAAGNIHLVGNFTGTFDFDPGPSTFTMASSGGSSDIYIQKLNSLGNFVWAKQIGGSGYEGCYAIDTDMNGNFYLSGQFGGTVDFDSGPGTYTVTASGSFDAYYLRLNSSGNFLSVTNFGAPGVASADRISVRSQGGALYIQSSGTFIGITDFAPGAPTFTLDQNGNSGRFFHRMTMCTNSLVPGAISGNTLVCPGTSNIYSISPVGGATAYQWYSPNGWTGTSTTNVITFTAGLSAGTISVSVQDACASSAFQTLSVSIGGGPPITVSGPNSLCSGNSATLTASGANSYTWNGGAVSPSIVVTPTSTSSYSVIGQSVAGCTSTAVKTVSVNATPNLTLSSNTNTICSSGTVSLSAGGAAFYFWNNGSSSSSIVATPSVTSTFTVYGFSAAGCTNIAVKTISVIVPPLTISGGNTLCLGDSIILTASGANSYTWNIGPTTASISISPTINTSYTVSGTNASGCSGSAVQNVTVYSLPAVTASGSSTLICIGQSATLTSNGASTYSWNNGGTGNSVVVSPTATTVYTVLGTNVNGCSNTASLTLSVSPCTSLDDEQMFTGEADVYPNPTNGNIFVRMPDGLLTLIKIYNTDGSVVYETIASQTVSEINMINLPAGIYFVKAGNITKKIVKQD